MLRIILLSVLVYFLDILLLIECKDGEITVNLHKSENNTECTISQNKLTFKEHALVQVNVTSQLYMNYVWIELPDQTALHFNSNAEGKNATTQISTHSKLKGEWKFVILHFKVRTEGMKNAYKYNCEYFLKATCNVTLNIEVANETAKQKTQIPKCPKGPLQYLPEWLPIPVISGLVLCMVIIIFQTCLIVHYKRKARHALPYNSLAKRSVEDLDSAVRYSTNPVHKKNGNKTHHRGSGVYEDPVISFPNGRPPASRPPKTPSPSAHLGKKITPPNPNPNPPPTGPPNIPAPETPRLTHLDITKKMLPVLPRTELIPKLNPVRDLVTQTLTRSSPMDIESSIANRPPLPLPKEEVYETMESDLPGDYDEPQTLEMPRKQPSSQPVKTSKSVAASPKSTRTIKKPAMLPPPEKDVKAAKAPMVNELNAALKQRVANAGTSALTSQKPAKTKPLTPNPILSPPPVRHKLKTAPTPRQDPQSFKEPSQLRLRPKPKASLSMETKTPVMARHPPKEPIEEAIYNEGEGNSDEERWDYEQLKPNHFYID